MIQVLAEGIPAVVLPSESLRERDAGPWSRLGRRGAAGAPREARVGAEEPLLDRARRGDPRAFEELFGRHREDVVRLCRRMLVSPSAGEDAAQEVFLRARDGFEAYDPARPFRRWLLAIASHHCIDQLRRRQRETTLFEARDLDAADLRDPGPSPLRHALDGERRAQLRDAIDALPHRYRLPLVLRYFEELDYGGIGEILGVTPNQVGTLLFRAKRRLREQLSGGAVKTGREGDHR